MEVEKRDKIDDLELKICEKIVPIAMSSVQDKLNTVDKVTNPAPTLKETIKHLKGYLYALLFALCSCMVNVMIKMSPCLDGSNHSGIRYVVQLTIMLFFIKLNNIDLLGPKKQRKLLFLRGTVGCMAAIFSYFSVKYLDISDIETLTNSCVLITAILARLFLDEKLTICHVFALVLTVTGVVFIIRPKFLFNIEENLEDFFHLNLTAHNMNISSMVLNMNGTFNTVEIKNHSNRTMGETILGVSLVLISACCMSMSQVIIKKLCLFKVHFSVSSIYPALCGLPISVLISLILIFTKSSHNDLKFEAGILPIQIVYSFMAGLFGTTGLIFLNKALFCEDASKVAMIKTTGVFFSFILQYLMLDIEVDFLGILGALFIVSSTLSIMIIKLTEPKLVKSKRCLKILAKKF